MVVSGGSVNGGGDVGCDGGSVVCTQLQGVAPCIEKTEIYSQKVGFRVPAASDYNAPQLRDVIKAGAWDYQFS